MVWITNVIRISYWLLASLQWLHLMCLSAPVFLCGFLEKIVLCKSLSLVRAVTCLYLCIHFDSFPFAFLMTVVIEPFFQFEQFYVLFSRMFLYSKTHLPTMLLLTHFENINTWSSYEKHIVIDTKSHVVNWAKKKVYSTKLNMKRINLWRPAVCSA